ncbi:hypothetical protein O988_08081 [Pseudogymnoascus sp. VKM F-3808]|nr:hypothetical protein O988_08081 [Pseudogymnoascus sp. VKM F-3808]
MKEGRSNRSVEWNCESPNPAIVRIPFPYDEREGQPAQASANHLSMKKPIDSKFHNGWPRRPPDSYPPSAPAVPVCRDWFGSKHVVLLDVQSEARRTCVIGLEAPLGALNVEDIQRIEWEACSAWARTDGHVASFGGVQIILVKMEHGSTRELD